MKVMCIDETGYANDEVVRIPVGEIVTVIGESDCFEDHLYIYEYLRTKNGYKASYHKKHFAPLSDLDETVIHAERFQPEPLNV